MHWKNSAFAASLYRHRLGLLLWLGQTLLLFAVYGLYDLPWGPAVYTALLGTVLAAGLWLLAFLRERVRLYRLREASGSALCMEMLPDAKDPFDKAYQALAVSLDKRCRETEGHAKAETEKAARYYTLWSHQIKTPIAAMRLLLQEGGENRQAMEQELFKTEQYVEMVLQYQRLGSASRDLVLRRYPLEELIRQAVRRMSTLFIHKKVSLSLAPVEAEAVTDEKWMVFVFEQVLSNAVKYTPSGGTVSVGPMLENPAVIVIADTGIGIRQEDLPRVTEWGYTGCNGRRDKRATGIGLSLCRQTLEMLGHTMRIESAVGAGTRVFLDLSRQPFEVE